MQTYLVAPSKWIAVVEANNHYEAARKASEQWAEMGGEYADPKGVLWACNQKTNKSLNVSETYYEKTNSSGDLHHDSNGSASICPLADAVAKALREPDDEYLSPAIMVDGIEIKRERSSQPEGNGRAPMSRFYKRICESLIAAGPGSHYIEIDESDVSRFGSGCRQVGYNVSINKNGNGKYKLKVNE